MGKIGSSLPILIGTFRSDRTWILKLRLWLIWEVFNRAIFLVTKCIRKRMGDTQSWTCGKLYVIKPVFGRDIGGLYMIIIAHFLCRSTPRPKGLFAWPPPWPSMRRVTYISAWSSTAGSSSLVIRAFRSPRSLCRAGTRENYFARATWPSGPARMRSLSRLPTKKGAGFTDFTGWPKA